MRVVWRGTISFGLVTIPVKLYVATESKSVPSHQIHLSDGGRVQYKRVCSIDGAEVPFDEIGRGYESATGELVVLSDDDLATLPASTSRSIEIISFLPLDAVDPIYFDRSYYVEPERLGAKAYRLMRDALHKRGRVAVTKVKLRDRQIIGVLRVNADVLVLATMLWPDEVRKPQFPFLAEADEWVAPSVGARHGGGADRLTRRGAARSRPISRRTPGNADCLDQRQGEGRSDPGGRTAQHPPTCWLRCGRASRRPSNASRAGTAYVGGPVSRPTRRRRRSRRRSPADADQSRQHARRNAASCRRLLLQRLT